MQIKLNNIPESFSQEQLNITEILAIKKFSFRMILVKLNNSLINKADFDITIVKNGDDLKIIHLMSGG